MTGLVFTISLLAAFQADAALPAASGAMYLSVMNRNGVAIERLRSMLPSTPDKPHVKVRKTGAAFCITVNPEEDCPCNSIILLPPVLNATITPVSTAPIRGPDSLL